MEGATILMPPSTGFSGIRVSTVREKSGKNEKYSRSGKSQGNLKFWQKSGKSQGILESEVEGGEIRL